MHDALDADATSFFEASVRGVYLIKACAACGTSNEPALIACKRCGSDALTFAEASGDAVLIACAKTYRAYDPAMQLALPYDIGVARLTEGPLAVSRIVGSSDELPAAGRTVRIKCDEVAGRLVPVFALTA
ncbi:Zn-ribbon domain-containing OB-fold protein [Burkholderia orbicola]|uniref:Zn-ribbon domain-containing OB-fold protein n=1 Tax=Burkholderia orbicola TaxID=2978683 RepID=UPI0039A6D019